MKGIIEIDSLKLFARHGVAEQEKTVGNTFEVSVAIEYPIEKAATTDHIEDTLNYASVIQVIKREMNIPSQLLEHAASRIIKALQIEFPSISGGKIKITKIAPPCGVEVKGVSIILNW